MLLVVLVLPVVAVVVAVGGGGSALSDLILIRMLGSRMGDEVS